MYKEIRSREGIYNLYRDELIASGDITKEEADALWNSFFDY